MSIEEIVKEMSRQELEERVVDLTKKIEFIDELANKTEDEELYIPYSSDFILLSKPNYKAKDGTIKRGIELNGNFYASKKDIWEFL